MLRVEQLGFAYGREIAVEDLSFELEPREIIAVVGGSGSGKSTSLKLINRLLEADKGRVLFDGRDTAQMDPIALRRAIGYVFQAGGLFPHLSVAENVAITPRLRGDAGGEVEAYAAELLEMVELPPEEFGPRLPGELSGGQAQRVAVARALAGRPSLVLLDEPFGALDILTRRRLQRSFLALRESLGFSALFVTHDMGEALALGDRVGVMHQGRLLQLATPQDLLRGPAHPYVAELTAAAVEPARDLVAQAEGLS